MGYDICLKKINKIVIFSTYFKAQLINKDPVSIVSSLPTLLPLPCLLYWVSSEFYQN